MNKKKFEINKRKLAQTLTHMFPLPLRLPAEYSILRRNLSGQRNVRYLKG